MMVLASMALTYLVEERLQSLVVRDVNQISVVHTDPEIMHGTPVFRGTRVPLQALFDYIEAGDSLDEFLHQFPTVEREQAVAALEEAANLLSRRAASA